MNKTIEHYFKNGGFVIFALITITFAFSVIPIIVIFPHYIFYLTVISIFGFLASTIYVLIIVDKPQRNSDSNGKLLVISTIIVVCILGGIGIYLGVVPS